MSSPYITNISGGGSDEKLPMRLGSVFAPPDASDNLRWGIGMFLLGMFCALILLVIWFLVTWRRDNFTGHSSIGSRLAHLGGPTGTNQGDDAVRSAQAINSFYGKNSTSGFMNGREAPFYPDVTNRVLHMENREKEAIRAYGKINQERIRRAAAEGGEEEPVEWTTFLSEWKESHPLDGESGYSVSGVEGLSVFDSFNPNELVAY